MALVSPSKSRGTGGSGFTSPGRRVRGRYLLVAALLGVLVLVGAFAIVFASARATLSTDSQALARIGLPLGGGSLQGVTAVTGQHARRVGIEVRDGRIWPTGRVRAGERISLDVVVRRPSWISWLAGKTQRLHLVVVAPTSAPTQDYFTLRSGQQLTVHFNHPVIAVVYGSTLSGLSRHTLGAPTSSFSLTPNGAAGSVWIAGLQRRWETATAQPVSWFPAGSATSAVATPAPGTAIKPLTPIRLTFSKPVSQALHGSMPPVSPSTSGSWHAVDAHTIVFQPQGYGYGLAAQVSVGLPTGVRLVGGHVSGSAEQASWSVPGGTTLRLQQLLAVLGYLPLRFKYTHPVAHTAAAQENAALSPPKGSFSWRYPNTPSALLNLWAPGTFGEMTKGAIMAFQNTEGMTADGIPGPQLWRALITATLANRRNTFGYTFVQVSEGSPETESTWHSGKTVVSGVVNTGIPAAPTAKGVFAVFEHALSVTMSGTNPDGSHYSDPGVPYVSYFNGGDALHGFLRASYGSAQSLGCVEMPYSEAAAVYPYTPIGTLVSVS